MNIASSTRLDLLVRTLLLKAIRYEMSLARYLDLIEGKYRPDQPRVPAGQSGGGQWTRDGGGRNDPGILSDITPDKEWKPGARYAQNRTRERYTVDLEEEEAPRGIGHTKRDHVEKADEELRKVLNDNYRIGIFSYRFQSAEGTFTDIRSANDFVNRILQDNKSAVDLVASGKVPEMMLEKRFGYITGKEAFRPDLYSEPIIRNTYAVRIVIRHDLRSERGYRVFTAFPINQDSER